MFETGFESSLHSWEKQADFSGNDWLAIRIEYKFPTVSLEPKRNLKWN